MDTVTTGTVGCLLLVFVTLAVLPLMRKDLLEGEANEKKSKDYVTTLKKNYREAHGAPGYCIRCTHHGRKASLKLYRNRNNRSLLLLLCPSCDSAFQVNAGPGNL